MKYQLCIRNQPVVLGPHKTPSKNKQLENRLSDFFNDANSLIPTNSTDSTISTTPTISTTFTFFAIPRLPRFFISFSRFLRFYYDFYDHQEPCHEHPFVDLKAQYQSIKNEIDQAIAAVIEKTAFIGGAYAKAFEEKFAAFCGVKHCIGVGNGTDALFIALKNTWHRSRR